MSKSHTAGPGEALAAKAGKAMHSCPEGRVALRPSATPGAEPEEARLCSQRSCSMLTRTQGPAAANRSPPALTRTPHSRR